MFHGIDASYSATCSLNPALPTGADRGVSCARSPGPRVSTRSPNLNQCHLPVSVLLLELDRSGGLRGNVVHDAAHTVDNVREINWRRIDE
jgi:hypothetical protein